MKTSILILFFSMPSIDSIDILVHFFSLSLKQFLQRQTLHSNIRLPSSTKIHTRTASTKIYTLVVSKGAYHTQLGAMYSPIPPTSPPTALLTYFPAVALGTFPLLKHVPQTMFTSGCCECTALNTSYSLLFYIR